MPRSLVRGALLFAVVFTALVLLVLTGRDEGKTRRPAGAAPAAPLGDVARRIGRAGLGEHLDALQRIAGEHGGNRAAGTAGERATAEYVAGRLRAAGYRVTVDEVSVPDFSERSEPRLTAGSRSYEARTLQFSGGGAVAGTVRAAGLGCSAEALAPLRRGDVALIQRGTCPFRAKALAAQRAGAAAVLIADEEPVRGSLQRPGVRVPALAVGASAAGLVGERVRVAVDAATTIRRSPSVIGETGDAGARRVLMAGGHLDSVPEGPGLNDNGSGVAALLEIAEELGGRRVPDGTALRFAFWGAEEIGLVGSRDYVDDLSPAERRRIAAYLNLDMVGSPDAEPAVYDGDDAIEAALRRRLGADAPERDLGDASDHAPFEDAGIPVGGIFTGIDDCYHRRCDTIDNVDRAVLTTSARAAGAALVDGFEVVYAQPGRLRGHTSAVEDGEAYAVRYEIALDDRWRTREVRVASDTVAGPRETVLVADGEGRWTVDGEPAPQLDGLIDVDLEASACTNTLPVHRLPLPLGEETEAPAAYVRALDLSVTRLDQTYRRLDDRRYDYTSEADFRAVLEYDASGLIVDYPGIAVRFA